MTNETLKNPSAPTIPTPESLDLALQGLQTKMVTGLSWLTKVFGRARMMQRDVAGEKRLEPMVYESSGEYYPALPNDALKAFSFFRVSGPRKSSEIVKNVFPMNFTCPVDLIVWGNLQKINPAKDYIFTEELLNDVNVILNKYPGLEIGNVYDEKMEDVYKGFTLFPEQRDMLMYPFFAFKIEFALSYYIDCP